MKYVIIIVIAMAIIVFVAKKIKKSGESTGGGGVSPSNILTVCNTLYNNAMANTNYMNGLYDSVQNIYEKDIDDSRFFEDQYLRDQYILLEDVLIDAGIDNEEEKVYLIFGDSQGKIVAIFPSNEEENIMDNLKVISDLQQGDRVLVSGVLERYDDSYAMRACIIWLVNGKRVEGRSL